MIKIVRIVDLLYEEQKSAINEVKILAALDSPYVVKYYDSFIDTESLHIVMEFCNKGDMQTLLKLAKERGLHSLNENVIWNIGLQVILGLHYIHSRRILHRDLKAANVFLSRDIDNGQRNYDVKIGDLGVAKLLDTSTAVAKTIVGTPYYLSPELCADKSYRDKSDCWALGVLLYECCCLRRPFEAKNQCALILKIIQEDPTPLPSSTPPGLRKLVMWLLKKEPSERPTIKDILNEQLVREKLEQCRSMDDATKFELPADLERCGVTNILRAQDEESSERISVPSGDGRGNGGGGGGSVWLKGSNREEIRPAVGNHRPGRHVQQTVIREGKASSIYNSSPNANPNANTSPKQSQHQRGEKGEVQLPLDRVRGNRVRGPSSRQHSSKARERYQIKPQQKESSPTPSTTSEDKADKEDGNGCAITRHIEVKGAFSKWEPFDVNLDYTNLIRGGGSLSLMKAKQMKMYREWNVETV